MRVSGKRIGLGVLGLAGGVAVVGSAAAAVAHVRGAAEADARWRAYQPPRVTGLDETTSLEILPLVTWHTAGAGLRGEAGLSYLVRTDSMTVLVDVGYNADGDDPSPLEHNMRELGVSMDDVDAIFITHNHLDHVGGLERQRAATFSLGTEQVDLGDVRVFTPVAMTYPGLEPVATPDPQRLGPGLATTGTIPRRLFIGAVDEQALAVNVAGKGIVLVVGCGHQTLPRLLARTEAAFDAPLYGVVGGLHYPVPEGRLKVLGIDGQRRFASGDGPWRPITREDVEAEARELMRRSPGLVALDPHDSSDEAIALFRDAFGPAYRGVEVGTAIRIGT